MITIPTTTTDKELLTSQKKRRATKRKSTAAYAVINIKQLRAILAMAEQDAAERYPHETPEQRDGLCCVIMRGVSRSYDGQHQFDFAGATTGSGRAVVL
jgi:hypothetical protein